MAKKKTLDELRTETAEEENRQRTHNLCCLGGLVLKYFGKDISVEDFQETLDYLFSLEDVKEYLSAEKEQRFLQDNPPAETYDNKITDEKTSA